MLLIICRRPLSLRQTWLPRVVVAVGDTPSLEQITDPDERLQGCKKRKRVSRFPSTFPTDPQNPLPDSNRDEATPPSTTRSPHARLAVSADVGR